MQAGCKKSQLFASAYVESENRGALRGIEDGALVGRQIDPIAAFDFGGDGPAVDQVAIRIEFQQCMATSSLADVGISSTVEDNRFGFAVVSGSEIPDKISVAIKLRYCVSGKVGHVQRVKRVKCHARNGSALPRAQGLQQLAGSIELLDLSITHADKECGSIADGY